MDPGLVARGRDVPSNAPAGEAVSVTPVQRSLAIWGGGTLVILIIGVVALAIRGSTLDDLNGEAGKLYADYVRLYHPDKPNDGLPESDTERELTRAKDLQADALNKAEATLVPELSPAYTNTAVNEADAQVHADYQAIRQLADSRKVRLPSNLPFTQGLDQDPNRRSLQLATLYLYRAVLDRCIQSGVTKIIGVTPDKAILDPSKSYMQVSCLFSLETHYEAGQKVLQELLKASNLGIGLSALHLEQKTDVVQSMIFTATLLYPVRTNASDPSRPIRTSMKE
jgi:hypothetical protein